MLTFKEYYIEQFRDVPKIWKIAKRHKKYFAFFATVLTLLNPWIIHTMYLYDTGLMEIDRRYQKK